MRDTMKPCHHTLSEDVIFKEVVVIGNGPSGLVTSFMLAGNVPYLKKIPEDLPIDDMLRARLSNVPESQSLYEADLVELAEGLEGRSQNPIPLLMDSLLRPCADAGIQADPLIEWKYDANRQIDHLVLGSDPPGGSWHQFPRHVPSLSPAAWLTLPPHPPPHSPPSHSPPSHSPPSHSRLPARAVAAYCRNYVRDCHLQHFFRNGVVVTSVTRLNQRTHDACPTPACPLNARFCITGYCRSSLASIRLVAHSVVVCVGCADRPGTVAGLTHTYTLTRRDHIHNTIQSLTVSESHPPSVVIVGSGLSAADAVLEALGRGLSVHHLHRRPAPALASLHPQNYPDYLQVYKMMCDNNKVSHPLYTSYKDYEIIEITPIKGPKYTNEDDSTSPKKVKLLNTNTKEEIELTVNVIAVLIGSKPDLFFLQTNFNLNCIQTDICEKCKQKQNKINEKRQCFLRNRWTYLKNVLGQSIQSCKSRYLNYTEEINGNQNKDCDLAECNKKRECKCRQLISKIENGKVKTEIASCTCNVAENKCDCQENPLSSGLGFGLDPEKPIDGRNNPIAIDKGTHEMLNAKGLYALGPLTGDNFIRFIPGGALAIVANLHRVKKTNE